MSLTKESILLVVVLNVIVAGVVVGGAFAMFGPDEPRSGPGEDSALRETVERQEGQIRDLRERLADYEALELAVKEQASRLAALETRRAGTTPAEIAGEAESAEPDAAAPEESNDNAKMLAEALGNMMKSQAKRIRKRLFDEILNPTPESEARARRRLGRMVDQVARNLELDSRDRAEVERILTEVDQRRRARLREVISTKSNPEDVTYEEVKVVLDESFEEEDRMIKESLPREKAEEYTESAAPFRQLIDTAMSAALPKEGENGK